MELLGWIVGYLVAYFDYVAVGLTGVALVWAIWYETRRKESRYEQETRN